LREGPLSKQRKREAKKWRQQDGGKKGKYMSKERKVLKCK
jgi:hypothetical protein